MVVNTEKLKYVTVADVQTVLTQEEKMGKKKSREKYTSKGIVGSPMKSVNKSDPGYSFRRLMNQRDAWKQGRNVVLTVPNPNVMAEFGSHVGLEGSDSVAGKSLRA